jgi:hypothetical protein
LHQPDRLPVSFPMRVRLLFSATFCTITHDNPTLSPLGRLDQAAARPLFREDANDMPQDQTAEELVIGPRGGNFHPFSDLKQVFLTTVVSRGLSALQPLSICRGRPTN